VIDHILAEVNLSISYYDRTMADAFVNSMTRILSVSLSVQEPAPVLNNSTELPSSSYRSFQTIQVRRDAEKRPRQVSENLPGT
jgi:hypothetical protein